ncbi:MAG: ABC transporter substrate-binding protein [Clostridia bacterium]|nr:ABC transporter substrate-binding protein [Clostridia bacterium]
MKRIVTLILALILTAFCAVSFASCGDSASKTKIAIVQPMDHTSLNQIRDTIIETLHTLGYTDANTEIIVKNASNDASLLPSIYQSLISDNVDVIIPIGTGTAQVAAAQTDTIPIVFAAVSDPVAAGLVSAFENTDKNITGVSDSVDVNAIFGLAAILTPDVKTFGFVYNASEINSSVKIAVAKQYCDAHGIAYKEATVTSTADIAQAAASIAGEVDAFFTPDDNTVASGMAVYAGVQNDNKTPIYVGADSMVSDGGFATVGIDYDILAKQVAEMTDRILKGGKIADNHVELVANPAKIINKNVADAMGITIPAELLSEFIIIE